MGRARIVSGGRQGLYAIELDLGEAEKQRQLQKLEAELVGFVRRIDQAEVQRLARQEELNDALAELDAAIEASRVAAADGATGATGGTGATGQLSERDASEKVIKARIKLGEANAELAALRAEKLSTLRRKQQLESVVTIEYRSAWCADFTEDATGYVATYETPGESQRINIAPGGAKHTPGDGWLVARGIQEPHQVYWNAAVLPGWQKFKPNFRSGRIININYDSNTASVRLDNLDSSVRDETGENFPVNFQNDEYLPNVPIEYMSCDADAFDVDDWVLIEFKGMSWARPKIVGFVERPKQCDFPVYAFSGNRFFYVGAINDTDRYGGYWLNFYRKNQAVYTDSQLYQLATSGNLTLRFRQNCALPVLTMVHTPAPFFEGRYLTGFPGCSIIEASMSIRFQMIYADGENRCAIIAENISLPVNDSPYKYVSGEQKLEIWHENKRIFRWRWYMDPTLGAVMTKEYEVSPTFSQIAKGPLDGNFILFEKWNKQLFPPCQT